MIMNFQDKTKNLLDTVTQLLDIDKEERRKYVTKFKEFNLKYIYNIDEQNHDFLEDKNDNKPVEKILAELNRHYANKDTKHSFRDFKDLFSQKLFFERVISVLQRELEYFMKERKFSEQLFLEFDQMIASIKKTIIYFCRFLIRDIGFPSMLRKI